MAAMSATMNGAQTMSQDGNLTQQLHDELDRLNVDIRRIKNQIDYTEILVSFWPLPNMQVRMERLSQEMIALVNQRDQLHDRLSR